MNDRTWMVLEKQPHLVSDIYYQTIASSGTHIRVISLRDSASIVKEPAEGGPSSSISWTPKK